MTWLVVGVCGLVLVSRYRGYDCLVSLVLGCIGLVIACCLFDFRGISVVPGRFGLVCLV